MRACVRLTREIFAQPAFDPYRGREIQPGADVITDDAIDAFIRDKVESAYHPCGTCRMGSPDDPASVVGPDTRVIGVDALRVVDASIMPRITNGNLNAPTIMLAEKAADAIRGLAPLAASNAAFYVAEGWEGRQR
jgi:choline dehydrogenase